MCPSPPSKAVVALSSCALVLLGLVLGCQPGNTYVPPPPPEVTVSSPVRRPVKTYIEYTGTTKAIETGRPPGPGQGIPQGAALPGGGRGQDRRPPAGDRRGSRSGSSSTWPRPSRPPPRRRQEGRGVEGQGGRRGPARPRRGGAPAGEGRGDRTARPARRNAASQDDLDKAQADLKKAAAQVEADQANLEQARADYVTNIMTAKANVAQAKAEVRNAEIDLGYCRITAPFDGRISRALTTRANLVGDGQATVLATIVKVDPIYAYMSVSESDLLMFRKLVREGKRVDFRKGRRIALGPRPGQRDGISAPRHPRLRRPDRRPGTGTLQARGKFPNPGGVNLPGPFLPDPRARSPDCPSVARWSPSGRSPTTRAAYYLLVVDYRNKVEQRYVHPRLAGEGGLRVIEENLKAGRPGHHPGPPGPGRASWSNPRRQEPTVPQAVANERIQGRSRQRPPSATQGTKRPEPDLT